MGQGDFTNQLQFVHPDDDNKDDRTVMQVHLPKPIPPDGYVQFKINSTINFRRRWSARVGIATSFSAASGFLRLEFGGMARGIAISFTLTRSSSPTSECMT